VTSPPAPAYAVILAAGTSTRFGDDKLLALLDGQPVLEHVIRAVQACEGNGTIRASYVVVPGPDAAVTQLVRQLDVRVVTATPAGNGMGWSLRAGFEAVTAAAPAGPAAALVVLGDQPTLQPEVVSALVRRWRTSSASVIRPRYADEPEAPGHPVLLDRSQWARVAALTGDTGLGPLATADAVLVEVRGRNPDIDTRADLRALHEKGTA
jgi:molybdenum cofactor cytidylyltransferase